MNIQMNNDRLSRIIYILRANEFCPEDVLLQKQECSGKCYECFKKAFENTNKALGEQNV